MFELHELLVKMTFAEDFPWWESQWALKSWSGCASHHSRRLESPGASLRSLRGIYFGKFSLKFISAFSIFLVSWSYLVSSLSRYFWQLSSHTLICLLLALINDVNTFIQFRNAWVLFSAGDGILTSLLIVSFLFNVCDSVRYIFFNSLMWVLEVLSGLFIESTLFLVIEESFSSLASVAICVEYNFENIAWWYRILRLIDPWNLSTVCWANK